MPFSVNPFYLIKMSSLSTLLFLLLFCSCEPLVLKEQNWTLLPTPAKEKLWKVQFINPDLGFAVGGDTYHKGVLWKTADGGNQWEMIPNEVGKVIYDIALIDSDHYIATAYDAKLLRSIDNGHQWELLQQNIPDHDWLPFKAIDFINDTLGLIVGGHAYNQGIIFRTINGGQNWSSEWLDIELRDVQFTDPSTAFIIGYGIIRKSVDAGKSWQPLEARGDYFTALHFPSEKVGYVVGYQGSILKTTDGGVNWETLRSADKFAQKRQRYEDVLFLNDEKGYIAGHQLLLVTEDGGHTWEQIEGLDFERFNGLTLVGEKLIIVGDNGTIVRLE